MTQDEERICGVCQFNVDMDGGRKGVLGFLRREQEMQIDYGILSILWIPWVFCPK